MYNGDGEALLSCQCPMKYLNESLPTDFLSDGFILLIYASLMLMGLFIFMKSAFNDAIFSEMYGFLFHFYAMKRKKVKFFI